MKIIIQVVKFVFVIVLGVSLSYILTSCKDETITQPGEVSVDLLTELPVVRITANNYEELSLQTTFGNTDIHGRFTQAYRGSYSTSLKESILGYLIIDLKNAGENEKDFIDCYNSVGEFKDRKCLPCLVESAKYEGKDAYIIVFNWGIQEDDFGHIAYYAIDKSTKKILKSVSCR